MEHNQMPLMRYFVFVGGALLALLFLANAWLPVSPVTESTHSATTNPSGIRIQSDRKWPERVVFDTSRPTIVPVPAPTPVMAEADTVPAKTVAPSLEAKVREAYAQLPANSVRAEAKRKRKSMARNYAGQPRILVAQQPRFAFFGNNLW
jgi:hypothetical protein